MRTIRCTTQFKRDYKRELKGRHGKTFERDLRSVLSCLVSDARLPEKHRDHPLAGEWKEFRDCHVRPISCFSIAKPMLVRTASSAF